MLIKLHLAVFLTVTITISAMDARELREYTGTNHHFNPAKNPPEIQKGGHWWTKFKQTKPLKVSGFDFRLSNYFKIM